MNGCKESIALMNAMLEKSLRRNTTVSMFTLDRIYSDLLGIVSHHGMDPLCLHRTGWWKQEQHDSILYHLHRWTHLVSDSRFDLYWIHQVPCKHKACLYQFHTSFKEIRYFVNTAWMSDLSRREFDKKNFISEKISQVVAYS